MITRRHMLAGASIASLAAVGRAVGQTATPQERSGTMEIKRNGSQLSRKGQAEYFTGSVRVDPLFAAPSRRVLALAR